MAQCNVHHLVFLAETQRVMAVAMVQCGGSIGIGVLGSARHAGAVIEGNASAVGIDLNDSVAKRERDEWLHPVFSLRFGSLPETRQNARRSLGGGMNAFCCFMPIHLV
jgi:hypothetical protein